MSTGTSDSAVPGGASDGASSYGLQARDVSLWYGVSIRGDVDVVGTRALRGVHHVNDRTGRRIDVGDHDDRSAWLVGEEPPHVVLDVAQVDTVAAGVDVSGASDADAQRVGRERLSGGCGCACHLDAGVLDKRRRQQEEDQQDKHHVDERCDVHLCRFAGASPS